MRVDAARLIARKWTQEQDPTGTQFDAAFLHGSITWLDDHNELAPTSDIDILVTPRPGGSLPARRKHHVSGLTLDVSTIAWTDLEPIETLLGSYHLAGSLRSPKSILVDPTGRLTESQLIVERDFELPIWVRARCDHAIALVHENVRHLESAATMQDKAISWLFAAGVCTHVLLVAGMRNPTVRTRYSAVRSMLDDLDYAEMYPPMIDLIDPSHADADLVLDFVDRLEPIFDEAVRVQRTWFHFSDDLSEGGRRGAIDTSRDLAHSGHPRDALFWIGVTAARCITVLTVDGTPQQQAAFSAMGVDLANHFDIATPEGIQERIEALHNLLPRLREQANVLIADRRP